MGSGLVRSVQPPSASAAASARRRMVRDMGPPWVDRARTPREVPTGAPKVGRALWCTGTGFLRGRTGKSATLRNQRDDPERTAAAAFDLHRQRHDIRSGRGQPARGAPRSRTRECSGPAGSDGYRTSSTARNRCSACRSRPPSPSARSRATVPPTNRCRGSAARPRRPGRSWSCRGSGALSGQRSDQPVRISTMVLSGMRPLACSQALEACTSSR